ncbi:MAG TPA: oxygenase MpaB family protein [Pseudonocardia sp.]|uniref:oxygenase MpaB family protein n=1 Tax=Pseudonocardia sp. TaxID=60912 RepID=UPI002B4B45A9|nr:oxygenase MpaB family protein [Pseudonocardia sp.]HLU55018.1 oxygenase MpaB family protein [Pseudonocardia sp.]
MSTAPPSPVAREWLFPPGSATRRVIGDPAALIGGISALFLQALHPRAMAGVDQHSSFPAEFWPRLQRTAGYVTTLAFGDLATAEKAAARVRGIHRRVRGVDPVTGRPYSADDPDLLRWVHVTEVSSFASAVRRLGLIDAAEEDRFLAEQVRAGELLGATDLPGDRAGVEEYFAAVRPELVASPVAVRAFSRLLLAPLPWRVALLTPARPAWTFVAAVAIGLLPDWAKRLYGIPHLPGADAATTAGLATIRAGLLAFRRATGREAPPR